MNNQFQIKYATKISLLKKGLKEGPCPLFPPSTIFNIVNASDDQGNLNIFANYERIENSI